MSELPTSSSEFDNHFLAEREKEIRAFLGTIHGQLDHATASRDNEGQLALPVNDENLLAAKWDSAAPQLPERLAGLITFEPGSPVTIEARYRYGLWASMVNIWISPHDSEHSPLSLGLRIDPRTGEVGDFGSTATASEYGGQIPIDEDDTRAVVDALFAENSEYQSKGDGFGVSDAFQLGILTQSDFGSEQYTVEVGEKSFAAYSRMRPDVQRSGQFDLKVRALNRAHPHGKPSKTWITLRRHFEPVDYDPEAVLDGIFEQEIKITQEADGRISDIERKSSVNLFDEPVRMRVNGKQTLATMLNKAGKDIPPELAEKLYPDAQPTLDDLQFFQRLVSQPITEEDLYIS